MPGEGRARPEGEGQVCAQLRNDPPNLPPIGSTLLDDALGVPPRDAELSLQQDVVKELVNKIAWTLGSVYRRNYSNMRTPARSYAWRVVKQVIHDHGYPDKIAK